MCGCGCVESKVTRSTQLRQGPRVKNISVAAASNRRESARSPICSSPQEYGSGGTYKSDDMYSKNNKQDQDEDQDDMSI